MINQISRRIYIIECDICGEKVAYFYDEIMPDKAIDEDGWHKMDETIHCAVCYKEPDDKIDFSDWSLNDLMLIADKNKDYFTKKGLICQVEKQLKITGNEWIPEKLVEKYEDTDDD